MKLLTHNMLACHIKGVKENQPFIIEVCHFQTNHTPILTALVPLQLVWWDHSSLCDKHRKAVHCPELLLNRSFAASGN